MKRAVFLDRDGTINTEKDYLYRIDDFEFIQGAVEAIRLLNESGYMVIVVTNQSGIARGYYTEEDLSVLHRYIADQLSCAGAHVDDWYFCPHHPTGKGVYAQQCSCRKPLPGMLHQAALRHGIDLERSFMIGDKSVDVEAAIAAGCKPILVRTGYGATEETKLSGGVEVYDDLLSAVRSLIISDQV